MKTSAGKLEEQGSRSSACVAPKAMRGHAPPTPPCPCGPCCPCGECGDAATCSASARTTRPACGQSSTKTAGRPSHSATSTARTGTYSVYESEKSQISPSSEGAGTPWPLKWKTRVSSLASRRSLRQLRCTCSTVGSRHCLKTVERELTIWSYCASSCDPIRATTLRGSAWLDSFGSMPQSSRPAPVCSARGKGQSGGSTSTLRHTASTPPYVRLLRIRHSCASGSGEPSASQSSNVLGRWRGSV